MARYSSAKTYGKACHNERLRHPGRWEYQIQTGARLRQVLVKCPVL